MDRYENLRIAWIGVALVTWIVVGSMLTSCTVNNGVCPIPETYTIGQQVIVDGVFQCVVEKFLGMECGKAWYGVKHVTPDGRDICFKVDTTRMKPWP
jgi:hypothetical protein